MRVVLPNGTDVLALSTRNTIENLRGGFAPQTVVPPIFRLARLVTGELAPLYVVTKART